MRQFHLVAAIAALAVVCPCRGAPGEFSINVKVQAGGRTQSAESGKPAGASSVFQTKVKEVILVQWSAVNSGAGAPPLSDVTLHVYLDRVSTAPDAPKPGPKALYESAVIQDFEPGAKSIGQFRMPMPEAGSYVIRIETIGAAKKLGKEVTAAMQVSVQ